MAARKRNYAAEYARRQQLARERGFGSYYRERVTRAQQQRPGVSRAAAAGHRSAADLLRALRRAPVEGTMVSFIGIDRQRDGTWRRASFTLLTPDGEEREFILGPHAHGPGGLDRLGQASAIIDSRGLFLIGGKYLQAMIEQDDPEPEEE